MVAAPQYSVFGFKGLRSSKTYSVDAYISDVDGALVRFDAGSGAGTTSPTEWRALEPVALLDVAVVTGLTDTTKIQLQRGNNPTGDFLRYAMHLTTLAKRPSLYIVIPAGVDFRATQAA